MHLPQSLQQWEWLIVNDASNSAEGLATLDRIRAWADPRIRVIDLPENRGLPGARNAGSAKPAAPCFSRSMPTI